jgi:hypothetical protein
LQTHLGRWLTHFGNWLARLGEVKPTPLQTLAILGGLAAVSIVGGLAFSDNAFGQACAIAIVPGLSIAIGIVGNRWYSKQGLDQQMAKATQNAVDTTLHLERSVRYVDDRLSEAQDHLENGRGYSGLIEVVRAKTATELSYGTAQQASRQWESVSASGAPAAQAVFTENDDEMRPRIREDNNPKIANTSSDKTHGDDNNGRIKGSVARIEDQYTLIINRGSEHGVKPEVVVAVLADGGDPIIDPETGEVIGELPTEKLRVKVFEVHAKYSRAATFRTFIRPKVEYPALTGMTSVGSELAEQSSASGAIDSINASVSKMIATELADPRPIREKIANAKPVRQKEPTVRREVTINIGDKVRQVIPDRRPMPRD